jgi:hypothetical protein
MCVCALTFFVVVVVVHRRKWEDTTELAVDSSLEEC